MSRSPLAEDPVYQQGPTRALISQMMVAPATVSFFHHTKQYKKTTSAVTYLQNFINECMQSLTQQNSEINYFIGKQKTS